MALPDLLTVEDLFDSPERSGASISPDGTRIAYLAPWRDRLNVWVQDLDPSGGFVGEPRCVTADQTRSVMSYQWTDDPRWPRAATVNCSPARSTPTAPSRSPAATPRRAPCTPS
ncbi:hypothetical protein [Nocardiopsis synnemataformans]|uniref:hypothetical protein n=1 Tax=Nocardiopsis synnemataformans TaxID=61305 RepID=UPI003EBD375C